MTFPAILTKTLHSRKFWASVIASIPFLLLGDWYSFAYVWMAYTGIQGAVDGIGHFKKPGPLPDQAIPDQVSSEDTKPIEVPIQQEKL
jgi:hypothetical protein